MKPRVQIIGGGLAGSEAAWQLAIRGFEVDLYEMRPVKMTGAHVTHKLAELVCSNSLGSKLPDRATGLLQSEIKILGSLLMSCAEATAVPAGGALAVDREAFAELVTQKLENRPEINIIRREMRQIPDGPVIIASGPLTSDLLAADIAQLTGQEYLYFYDAIAPIVTIDSIDMTIAFHANRYGRGDNDSGDYINCPMTKHEYLRFVKALRTASTTKLRDFEQEDAHFFEGCLPIEQLAARGDDTLAYGPMRPVGIRDPRTGERPYAIVQLRQDNLAGSLYNIVGFQTNIRWGEQEQILRLIPGLANAEFVRMGQIHRNTFLNSPTLLFPTLQFKTRDDLFFAGQITGVEGYVGNIATGLVAAVNLALKIGGQSPWILPRTTMLGALCHYITHAENNTFQPMKANFGILPDLPAHVRNKRDRYAEYVKRAITDLTASLHGNSDSNLQSVPVPTYNSF
ncbi:MAG: methylenetetrahydrofolate--tRNA-(uracil(54)-C(5))-methyltransferase (FADH(2)-oxidizing) TrmFO [Anaerolineae bacterium]